jgi:RimJ/RimL family protein N-acetyltransferase
MEKMPYQEHTEQVQEGQTNAFEWHFGLPTLHADKVTLREVRESDAPALLAMLTTDEVAEFVSPLPHTIEGFHGFIRDVHDDRLAGNSFCFAIVPDGYEDAMGLFQVRQLEPGFGSAEWGFALGSPFWGTGVFNESTSRLASSVSIDSRRARSLRTAAATPRCEKWVRCRKACFADRSFATADITTRFCGRFSRTIGARQKRSGVRNSTDGDDDVTGRK